MTAAAAEPVDVTISEPGVYEIPVEAYHRDPVVGGSLSSTGARKLWPPSVPAKFQWWRDHGDPPRTAWDEGHAAHRLVLGTGPELVEVEATDWKTKAAQRERDAARAEGKVPLLTHQLATAEAMAAAVRAHPTAGPLFDPARGRAEQTLVAQDPETGVMCRALLDFLHDGPSGRRAVFLLPDYKSGKSAAPEDLPKVMHSFGYHGQLDWYIDLVRWTGAAGDAPIAGLLVVQEKDPPYLISIAQPDPTALGVARTLNRYARELYRRCAAAGEWPGYPAKVHSLRLPPWVEWRHKDAVDRGDFHFDDDTDIDTREAL